MAPKPLTNLASAIPAIYQRQALHFDAVRDQSLYERRALDQFIAILPATPRVLDLGCGTGRPIAAYLRRSGLDVTGIDAAPAMIDRARAYAPTGDWRVGDMRVLNLSERFDGIVSWNAFFHLTAEDQIALIPRLARHLLPGGALLLTVGPGAGEALGQVGSDRVYHASLSPDAYERHLGAQGLSVVDFRPEDPDCRGHSVLLARKDQPDANP